MTDTLVQLGAVAVVFIFAVKEFFAYLKTRKNGNGNGSGHEEPQVLREVLHELRLMNENHLHSLERAINDGNDRVVEAINGNAIRQIELLGEIKGRLER